jgi:hypothetical protein
MCNLDEAGAVVIDADEADAGEVLRKVRLTKFAVAFL